MKLPTANPKAQGSRSFTLVEILVAISIFLIVAGGAINLFVSSLSSQRQVIWERKLADELSFFTESLSRALRESKRSTGVECAASLASGLNYKTNAAQDELYYIDSNGECHRVYREVVSGIGTIRDDLGGTFAFSLTSSNVDVRALRFELLGASGPPDLTQPRVTISIEAAATRVPAASAPLMRLQTTISQRALDQ